MQNEINDALEGDKDLDKKIYASDLNGVAQEDFILPINNNYSMGNVAFGLVQNAKVLTFLRKTAKLNGTGK